MSGAVNVDWGHMRERIGPMAVFLLGVGFAGLGSGSQFITLIFGGIVGVAVAWLLVLMWQERTRPQRNGIWFLVNLVLLAGLVLSAVSPIKGFVVAIPVALWWLHDAPGSPTVMLSWGFAAILWQPFELWGSTADDSQGVEWLVAVASLIMIGAAQWERERLARQRDAPVPAMWQWARIGIVTLWTVIFILAREGLQAVNVFTGLGIDLTGTPGRFGALGLVLLSLMLAAVLFRVRPQKDRPTALPSAPGPARPAASKASTTKAEKVDFDAPSRKVDFDAPVARAKKPAAKAGAKPAAGSAATAVRRAKAAPPPGAPSVKSPTSPKPVAKAGIAAGKATKPTKPAPKPVGKPAAKPKASRRIDFD